MIKRILILGIDTFARKNIPQIDEMNKRDYFYDIFTNDSRDNSKDNFSKVAQSNRLIVANRNLFSRILQVFSILRSNNYNHVELYPAGRMAIFYILFCKLFKKKIVTIERGDIGIFYIHNFIVRNILKLAYKTSNIIWYKEPYMKAGLLKYTHENRLFFLPNAAPDIEKRPLVEKNLDFVWVNRLVKERRSDWFVDALKDEKLNQSRTLILGFQKVADPYTLAMQAYVSENINKKNVTLLDYANPYEYYDRASFFVLPTTIVFGNNSLLESMNCGVIPIVSETDATGLIIKDGENGLVFPHTQEGLQKTLIRAFNLDSKEKGRLSNNAKDTINKKYSQTAWGDNCITLYNAIHYKLDKN